MDFVAFLMALLGGLAILAYLYVMVAITLSKRWTWRRQLAALTWPRGLVDYVRGLY